MAKQKDKQGKPAAQAQAKPVRFSLPVLDKHPYGFAACVLVVLFVVFFNPLFFSGKTLLPPDTVASTSYRPFVDDAMARGIYPIWNPYIFGGMPFFASLSALFVDPINDVVIGASQVVRLVSRSADLVEIQRVLLFLVNNVLFGFFTFVLMRRKSLSNEAALFGAVALSFMPQIIGYSAFGHNTKLATAALIPLVFLLVDELLEKRNLLAFCLAGLAVGVQLLRAHVQICYYTLLTVGLYFLFWAAGELRARRVSRAVSGGALLAGAVLAGLLVSSVLNLSVLEYSRYSIRGGDSGGVGYEYATGWSFSPLEMATFFIPSFMGFGRETYWGSVPFTDFPLYFGLVPFLLAIGALVLRRDRITVFFGTLAGLSLLASFGKHLPVLYWPMYKFLPFFNKFRAPDMIHVLLKLSVVVLAATGIHALTGLGDDPKGLKVRRLRRVLAVFGGVLAVLFFLLLFGKNAYLNWAARAGDARYNAYDMAVMDGFKAVCLFGIAAFLMLRAAGKRLGSSAFAFSLALLTLADLWLADRRFVEFRPRADVRGYFAETLDVRYLKNQKDPFRILTVLDGRSPNWYAYHFIQSAFGYHPAKIRNYQELLDALGLPNDLLLKYFKQVDGGYAVRDPKEIPEQRVKAHRAFLKMMNIRYVLCPYTIPDSSLVPVMPAQAQGLSTVYEFREAMPRAYFPNRTIVAQGKDAVLGYMASGLFDPAETAVLEEKPPAGIEASDSNRVEITAWDLHSIGLKADVKTPSLLVLSESYYPAGWTAVVDGNPAKILKTNYVQRSVFLEPGRHEVKMEFRPRTFGLGLSLTLGSTAVLALGAVLGVILGRRRKPTDPVPVETST